MKYLFCGLIIVSLALLSGCESQPNSNYICPKVEVEVIGLSEEVNNTIEIIEGRVINRERYYDPSVRKIEITSHNSIPIVCYLKHRKEYGSFREGWSIKLAGIRINDNLFEECILIADPVRNN